MDPIPPHAKLIPLSIVAQQPALCLQQQLPSQSPELHLWSPGTVHIGTHLPLLVGHELSYVWDFVHAVHCGLKWSRTAQGPHGSWVVTCSTGCEQETSSNGAIYTYVGSNRVLPNHSAVLPEGAVLQLGRRQGQDGAAQDAYVTEGALSWGPVLRYCLQRDWSEPLWNSPPDSYAKVLDAEAVAAVKGGWAPVSSTPAHGATDECGVRLMDDGDSEAMEIDNRTGHGALAVGDVGCVFCRGNGCLQLKDDLLRGDDLAALSGHQREALADASACGAQLLAAVPPAPTCEQLPFAYMRAAAITSLVAAQHRFLASCKAVTTASTNGQGHGTPTAAAGSQPFRSGHALSAAEAELQCALRAHDEAHGQLLLAMGSCQWMLPRLQPVPQATLEAHVAGVHHPAHEAQLQHAAVHQSAAAAAALAASAEVASTAGAVVPPADSAALLPAQPAAVKPRKQRQKTQSLQFEFLHLSPAGSLPGMVQLLHGCCGGPELMQSISNLFSHACNRVGACRVSVYREDAMRPHSNHSHMLVLKGSLVLPCHHQLHKAAVTYSADSSDSMDGSRWQLDGQPLQLGQHALGVHLSREGGCIKMSAAAWLPTHAEAANKVWVQLGLLAGLLVLYGEQLSPVLRKVPGLLQSLAATQQQHAAVSASHAYSDRPLDGVSLQLLHT